MTEKNYRNWQTMRADGYAAYQRKYGRRMLLSGLAGWLGVTLVFWLVSPDSFWSPSPEAILVMVASAILPIASIPFVLKYMWQHYESNFLELNEETSSA